MTAVSQVAAVRTAASALSAIPAVRARCGSDLDTLADCTALGWASPSGRAARAVADALGDVYASPEAVAQTVDHHHAVIGTSPVSYLVGSILRCATSIAGESDSVDVPHAASWVLRNAAGLDAMWRYRDSTVADASRRATPRALPKAARAAERMRRWAVPDTDDWGRHPRDAQAVAEGMLAAVDPMLLWVAPDMVALAGDAAVSLTEQRPYPPVTDWPADVGFVALATPYVSNDTWSGMSVHYTGWRVADGWVYVDTFADYEATRATASLAASATLEAFQRADPKVRAGLPDNPRVMPLASGRWRIDDPTGRATVGAVDPHPLAMLHALWHLMRRDGITATRDVQPLSAKERRSARRAGRPTPDVRIIDIRSGTATAGAYAGTTREYRHRWVVRGHWRRQWVPSLGEHRQTYISPFVKGPAGAPMLGGAKVHTFRGDS